MKIFIACSKHFYDRIPVIKEHLEKMGHSVHLPNSFDAPMTEEEMKKNGPDAHRAWKASMLRKDHDNISANDAIVVLNFEKKGQLNYIGGATFLEIAKAFELEKKIFLHNPVPESIFKDELLGMGVVVINGDLTQIR